MFRIAEHVYHHRQNTSVVFPSSNFFIQVIPAWFSLDMSILGNALSQILSSNMPTKKLLGLFWIEMHYLFSTQSLSLHSL